MPFERKPWKTMAWILSGKAPRQKEKCNETCPIFATWRKTEAFFSHCFFLPVVMWKWQAKSAIPKAGKKKPSRVPGPSVCVCVKKRQDASVLSKSHPFFMWSRPILTFLPRMDDFGRIQRAAESVLIFLPFFPHRHKVALIQCALFPIFPCCLIVLLLSGIHRPFNAFSTSTPQWTFPALWMPTPLHSHQRPS